MNDHRGEEMKGRVKEAAGDLTDNKDLKREGQIDRGSAATKQAVDKTVDKVKDVAE